MSIKAMNLVFETDLEPNQKIVMLVLADYADENGYCFPGQGKLSQRSSMSVRTLQRRINELVDGGWITRERRHDDGGHRTSNGYRLTAKLAGRPCLPNQDAYLPTVAVTKEPPVRTTSRKKEAREVPIPDDWEPTEDHRERAKTSGLDVDREAELFRLHAETHGRMAKQWNSAFTTWLIKAADKPANVTTIRPNLRVVEPAPEYPDQDELRRRREAAIEKTKAAAADPKFLTDYGLTPEEVERNRRRMEGIRARRREEEP